MGIICVSLSNRDFYYLFKLAHRVATTQEMLCCDSDTMHVKEFILINAFYLKGVLLSCYMTQFVLTLFVEKMLSYLPLEYSWMQRT